LNGSCQLLQLKPFIQQAVMDIGNDDIYKEADFEIETYLTCGEGQKTLGTEISAS
jgi:hypothetical protein